MSKWSKKKKQYGAAASPDDLKRELAEQMEDEEYGEALGTVADMIQAGIQDADAFYDAAYSYFMSGDYERAAQWVDNTLRFAPQHIKARILLARICLLEERTEDGLAIFEFVLKNYANELLPDEREDLAEVLDYYGTTQEAEIRASYPAIAAFLHLAPAANMETASFQPLVAPQVQPSPKVMQPQAVPAAAEDDSAASAERLCREVLAKEVSLAEKLCLLNSFAGGFFLAGDFPAAKLLLKKALEMDAHDEASLRNMCYTLVACGDRDMALQLVSMMKAPDFGILAAVRG